jgi:hypothetical protein
MFRALLHLPASRNVVVHAAMVASYTVDSGQWSVTDELELES